MKSLAVLTFITGVIFIMNTAYSHRYINVELSGAYQLNKDLREEVVIFADGYFTHTVFNKKDKKFISTRGGVYTIDDEDLIVQYEFNTMDTDQVGREIKYTIEVEEKEIEFDLNGEKQEWARIDDGDKGLAGLWEITARRQEDKLVPIHQRGTRKTIKILSSTRFQWAAIDPGTRQFMGTGGGTYQFENGKYTENIEFFSRDSTRVGQSLNFDGRLENGEWHHSGMSSKGDPIYEVWSRKKQ